MDEQAAVEDLIQNLKTKRGLVLKNFRQRMAIDFLKMVEVVLVLLSFSFTLPQRK